MHFASSNWETAGIWTPLGVIGGLALSAFVVVLTWRLLPRQQRLFYSAFETPLLSGMRWLTQTQPKIKVIVDDEELAAPRVVTVRLVAKCTRDIPASSFDRDRPLTIDFGSRVVATEALPGSPEWRNAKTICETEVRIAPLLIRKGSVLTFTAIVDGSVQVTVPDPPLIDVGIVERDWSWNPVPWWKRAGNGLSSQDKTVAIVIMAVTIVAIVATIIAETIR